MSEPIRERAIAQLLAAARAVSAYDWSDCDTDAFESVEALRTAIDDFAVVEGLATPPVRGEP
jgi:hypothetical protein